MNLCIKDTLPQFLLLLLMQHSLSLFDRREYENRLLGTFKRTLALGNNLAILLLLSLLLLLLLFGSVVLLNVVGCRLTY